MSIDAKIALESGTVKVAWLYAAVYKQLAPGAQVEVSTLHGPFNAPLPPVFELLRQIETHGPPGGALDPPGAFMV